MSSSTNPSSLAESLLIESASPENKLKHVSGPLPKKRPQSWGQETPEALKNKKELIEAWRLKTMKVDNLTFSDVETDSKQLKDMDTKSTMTFVNDSKLSNDSFTENELATPSTPTGPTSSRDISTERQSLLEKVDTSSSPLSPSPSNNTERKGTDNHNRKRSKKSGKATDPQTRPISSSVRILEEVCTTMDLGTDHY